MSLNATGTRIVAWTASPVRLAGVKRQRRIAAAAASSDDGVPLVFLDLNVPAFPAGSHGDPEHRPSFPLGPTGDHRISGSGFTRGRAGRAIGRPAGVAFIRFFDPDFVPAGSCPWSVWPVGGAGDPVAVASGADGLISDGRDRAMANSKGWFHSRQCGATEVARQ